MENRFLTVSSLIPSISAMKVLCLLALLVTLLSVEAAPKAPGPMVREAPVYEDRYWQN